MNGPPNDPAPMGAAPRWSRRRAIQAAAAAFGTPWARRARARFEDATGAERASTAGPRAIAISGDRRGPKWDERLTITVGASKGADIRGASEKAIQAAVDQVARLGGGNVRILPGVYRCRNAVYLASGVRLVGDGPETVLIKEPSHSTALAENADWYDQEIALADARGFQLGDGICLRAKNPHNGGPIVLKRTLVARSGNRFRLDRALRENLWLEGKPTAAALFPIVSGENVREIAVENLALDGDKAHNELLDGNYAGCVWLQDCSDVVVRGVVARHYHGDGISWQICHDVHVEECHSHDHAGLGFHPGSGSQRSVLRSNRSERNQIGIFFCWGARFGLAEKNTIVDARESGISIGHRDTDNVIRDNTITGSGQVGVLFRDETAAFAAHRNRVEGNRIVNSGPNDGIGIDVRGETDAVVLARNQVRETRGPMSRMGIRIGAKTGKVELAGNRVEGCAVEVSDLRECG